MIMTDPLSAATAFATIVQLIALYRQDRGARKDLDHRDFIQWLDGHRHEQIKELITNTYHLQSEVDALLRQDHAFILEKLDDINRIASSILARVEGFSALAEVILPGQKLSPQAASLTNFAGTSVPSTVTVKMALAAGNGKGV